MACRQLGSVTPCALLGLLLFREEKKYLQPDIISYIYNPHITDVLEMNSELFLV